MDAKAVTINKKNKKKIKKNQTTQQAFVAILTNKDKA
jgi:PHD/YefM family antitoxin component YafN of YafNO toxin-antitoxin module